MALLAVKNNKWVWSIFLVVGVLVVCWLLSEVKICIDTDFGHSFRGFQDQSLLGGYNYISSMGLSVGDN